MRGPTVLMTVLWSLFFFASRFHECAASILSQSQTFLPQVCGVPPLIIPFLASLRLIILPPPQGFLFDWNPPGTTVPIPITRTFHFLFFFGCCFVCFAHNRRRAVRDIAHLLGARLRGSRVGQTLQTLLL
jgi:hypothetical protein